MELREREQGSDATGGQGGGTIGLVTLDGEEASVRLEIEDGEIRLLEKDGEGSPASIPAGDLGGAQLFHRELLAVWEDRRLRAAVRRARELKC